MEVSEGGICSPEMNSKMPVAQEVCSRRGAGLCDLFEGFTNPSEQQLWTFQVACFCLQTLASIARAKPC